MGIVRFLIGSVFMMGALLSADLLAAEGEAAPKITYEDHVKPILREHCFTCHNQNEKKGGLALDTYASTIEGGAGGEVVFDGDSGSSRLWSLMAHEDTPVMPPGQDKLPDAKINVVRDWINGGMLENSGSKAKKKATNSLAFSASADGKPDGPAAMPETVWKQPVVVTERAAAVTAIKSSPWAPLVAIAGQKQVVLYNTDTGKLAGILPFPEGEPQSLAFSRDGSYLLVGGGVHSYQGITVLYDIKTGDRVARCGDELDIVFGSDMNDSVSKVALGGPKRLVRIHDVASGEQLFELKKHTDWVYAVRFSPDGIIVASGDRAGGLVLWEADTGRLYLDLVGHKDAIRGIAWRADSNLVASASLDGTVKLWDVVSGNQIKSFNAHGGGVSGIDMARDGRIVTCGKDRLVKLWDANGNAVRDFPAMSEAVLEVAFSHDGSHVIAGDWNGQIKMWKTDDPNQVVELSSNPPTLETRLASVKAAAQSAEAAFQQHSATLASLNEQLSTANNQLKLLTEQLAAAKAESEATDAMVKQSEAAVQTAASELSNLTQTESATRAKVDEAAKATADLVARKDALVQKIKELEQASSAAIAARDAADAQLRGIDQKVAELQASGAAPIEQATELQNQRAAAVGEQDKQAKALEAVGQGLAQSSSELKATVEPLVTVFATSMQAQKEFGDVQVKLAETRAKVNSADQTLKTARAALEAVRAKVTQIETQIPAAQQMVTNLTTQRDQTQAMVDQAVGPRDSLVADVKQLEADLAAFTAAGQQLAAAEAELQAKLEAAKQEVETKQLAAAEVAGKLLNEDEKLKSMREQLAALEAQVNQLKAAKNELESAQAGAVATAEATESEKQKISDRKSLYESAYVGN